ncbi:hypothetical protein BY458DRAFT_456936 [Sporodiniella umbellata]|nr:hypothetical protein BY458DRAFT_456936 [Sporodiniella umbellata]
MKICLSANLAAAVFLAFTGLTQAKTYKTKVAILGGGVSGISAALELTKQGIHDFTMVEAREELGGRAQNKDFGNTRVELGCNWVQGLGTNPINKLAKKYKLHTAETLGDSVVFYDDKGKIDGMEAYVKFQKAVDKVSLEAFERIRTNQADLSARAALSLVGWEAKDALDDNIEYYVWDWEMGEDPAISSSIYSSRNKNWTYTGFGPNSGADNLVIDKRGFKYAFIEESKQAFKHKKSRVMLNSTIRKIEYNTDGVVVHTDKGDTIYAEYAISTFSIGVMQHKDIEWSPVLPKWKKEGIYAFDMATYTKIFFNFPKQFWDDEQFILYSNPIRRGYFSVWQSLTAKGFLPKNTSTNIIFATVTQDMSKEIERMTDEEVKKIGMDALRKMYGDDIPEPTDFMFPRWHSNPLFRGSYSNWPIGELYQHHQNIKAPLLNRLFFAGEALSSRYYGFLQGAWFSGIETAGHVVKCVKKECEKIDYYPQITTAQIRPEYFTKRNFGV